MPDHRRRRKKLGYRKAERSCGNCQRSKSRCQPGTGSSCLRCERVGKICDLEAKETSQDMPASGRTARSLFGLPSGEPEQGTTELHTSVRIDSQQKSSVVSGLSVTKCCPPSRLNPVSEPVKTVSGDVSEFLEEMPSSGSGSNTSLLSVAAPPITPESEYWHPNGTAQLLEPLYDGLSSYQLSSTPFSYDALHDGEAFAVHFPPDGSSWGLGHLPSQVTYPSGDWQSQQDWMLDERQNQQEEMLLPPQSIASHWWPMQCFM